MSLELVRPLGHYTSRLGTLGRAREPMRWRTDLTIGLVFAVVTTACGSGTEQEGGTEADGGAVIPPDGSARDSSSAADASESAHVDGGPANDAKADSAPSSSDAAAAHDAAGVDAAVADASAPDAATTDSAAADAALKDASAPDAATTRDASTQDAGGTPDAGGPLLATGDTRSVTQPSLPAVCATVTAQFKTSQRGSPPSSDDTNRLQSALDGCATTGKSVVLAASGANNAFFSGTLTVNGDAIVVDSGVTLFGNDSYSTELLSVEGKNAAVMGPGTIDGRGDLIGGTPRLIQAKSITDFTVYDVTLQNAGKEHLYVEGGNGFTAWNLTIATPADTANTDGVDIDSMTNATVYGSFIEDGDDGVAIKTNSAGASNITIENSTFHGTHGLSIGSQTFHGVTNVLWQGNTVYGSDTFGNTSTDANAINIKSDPTCGGPVKQVTYLDTCMTGVKHLLIFNTSYGACSGSSGTPQYTYSVVKGELAARSPSRSDSTFQAFSAGAPLGLTLMNVSLDATGQMSSQDANVGLYNSNITPSGSGVVTTKIAGSGSLPSCSF